MNATSPIVLLFISGKNTFEAAEKALSMYGCRAVNDLDDLPLCDLVIADTFFVGAGLPGMLQKEAPNKPWVLLLETAFRIRVTRNVIDLRDSGRSTERVIYEWLESRFHDVAYGSSKTFGNGLWTSIALDEQRLAAAS